MVATGFFTTQDIASIRGDSSPHSRVAIAERIGYHFHQLTRTSNAYKVATELALLLQQDADPSVRVALAHSVAAESKCPVRLATLLATDTEENVAIPVLRQSPKLSDAALIPIIRATRELNRLMAIAEREKLSATICWEMLQKHMESLCLQLVERHNSQLDTQCQHYIQQHYTAPAVDTLLRKYFPQLPARHDNAPTTAANDSAPTPKESAPLAIKTTLQEHYARTSKEETAIRYAQWQSLAEQLNREGALTPQTMLLALGMGLIEFFACAIARQSRQSLPDAMAACQSSENDFRELYIRTHLPAAMLRLCWWSLSASRELLAQNTQPSTDLFCKSMAQKYAQAEKLKINMAQTIARPVAHTLLS